MLRDHARVRIAAENFDDSTISNVMSDSVCGPPPLQQDSGGPDRGNPIQTPMKSLLHVTVERHLPDATCSGATSESPIKTVQVGVLLARVI